MMGLLAAELGPSGAISHGPRRGWRAELSYAVPGPRVSANL